MKLVRARPREVEHLPEWAKCCDEYIRVTQRLGEMVVDLSTVRGEAFRGCAFCRAPRPESVKRVMDVADGLYVNLETLDLDEGTESQSAHELGDGHIKRIGEVL